MAREPKQRKATLNWLRTQGDLTFGDAFNILHIGDVRKRIEELRNEGYNIATVPVPGRKYKAYRLIEEAEA